MPRDYSITVKVLNNRLLAKMRERGYQSGLALSKACGVSCSQICAYLRMEKAPLIYNGEKWSPAALRLAEHLLCLPEDMFPPAQLREAMKKNTAEFTADAVDIHQISASLRSMALPSDEKMLIAESRACLGALLNKLSVRERNVINQRFGLVEGKERTLAAIGVDQGVRQERIRQIQEKALRKMRAWARDKHISGALRSGMI